MSLLKTKARTLALIAVIVPLLAVFANVAMRSGPLAPVKVTVIRVEEVNERGAAKIRDSAPGEKVVPFQLSPGPR